MCLTRGATIALGALHDMGELTRAGRAKGGRKDGGGKSGKEDWEGDRFLKKSMWEKENFKTFLQSV